MLFGYIALRNRFLKMFFYACIVLFLHAIVNVFLFFVN